MILGRNSENTTGIKAKAGKEIMKRVKKDIGSIQRTETWINQLADLKILKILKKKVKINKEIEVLADQEANRTIGMNMDMIKNKIMK